ncbi:hypothetical protein ES703_75200 [subsurface metagenome]
MNKKFPAFSIIILLFMGISLYGQKLPKPRGYVNDFAGVIFFRRSSPLKSALRDPYQFLRKFPKIFFFPCDAIISCRKEAIFPRSLSSN